MKVLKHKKSIKKLTEKDIEKLIIKQPDYIDKLYSEGGFQKLPVNIKKHIEWCKKQFNLKPFSAVTCYKVTNGRRCHRLVTKLSLYKDTIDPYFWCEECNPYQSAAPDGALFVVTNYSSALNFAKKRCNGDKYAYRRIIEELCKAKGIRMEITGRSIHSFFYE